MVAKTKRNPEIEARVQGYIDGVMSGEIVVGRYVRLMVERHVADVAHGPKRGLWFDKGEASFAIEFIELLKHSKGEWANTPLHLEPWQAFIVWVVHGWFHKSDGRRRYNTAFIKVARKNGKSTLGAALGMKLFAADGEEGAEVYTAATKRDQARIVHEEAKRMVRKSPSLKKFVQILRDNLSIPATNSKYEPLGADADTTDGLNISGVIVDEIHAHKTRDLWDVIETGTGARRNPLIWVITTAGAGVSVESIYWELRNYSMKVLEGTVKDDSWFGYLAELDGKIFDEEGSTVAEEDDWTDEKNWIKANPNLGVSVKIEDLRRKCKKAIEATGAGNNFRRKHLNQEVESDEAWLPDGLWAANSGGDWYGPDGLLTEVAEKFRGRPCYAGADLSSVDDLTCIVLAFQNDDGSVDVLPFFWCPKPHAVTRTRDKRIPYLAWAQTGLLTLSSEEAIQYDFIRAKINELRDGFGFDIREIAFDPHNARYLQEKLQDEDGFTVFDHRQGFISMNDPCKQARSLLLNRQLNHGNHDVLSWCVSNAVKDDDPAGNEKLNKKKSPDKIDGAVALVMAVGRVILNNGPVKTSYYEFNPVGMR